MTEGLKISYHLPDLVVFGLPMALPVGAGEERVGAERESGGGIGAEAWAGGSGS